jgi:WD40 repeat protein
LLAAFYGAQTDIWSLLDGKLLYSLPGDSIDFSPDGRVLVSAASVDPGWRIHLYEAQSGKLIKDWPGERAAFLPDNRLALEQNGAIRIYDPSTGKVPYVFNGRFPAFSQDGTLIALLYYDQVEIHRFSDGKLLHRLPGDFADVDRFELRFAPDGQSLAGDAYWAFCCAGSASRLSLWGMTDGVLLRDIPFEGQFSFSPDGSLLAVAGNGFQIWNTADGSVRFDLKEITIQ